jgi:hypothetical protein
LLPALSGNLGAIRPINTATDRSGSHRCPTQPFGQPSQKGNYQKTSMKIQSILQLCPKTKFFAKVKQFNQRLL